MKVQIETIPVTDAFLSGDECPFCHLERLVEQRSIRYVLGSGASYMEPDMRATTDKAGFCRSHYQKMYDYGNQLGSALMLQTYMALLLEEFEQEKSAFSIPEKHSLFNRLKKTEEPSALVTWLQDKTSSCYICDHVRENMKRYYDTFFVLIRDPEFRELVEKCKGFCLPHFAELMEHAATALKNAQREWFYPTVMDLMESNLVRVKEDLDLFVDKHNYCNVGLDWKNSRDAVPRAMEKMKGGHPSDKPYKVDF